ncbi:MAG: CinA family nicotinamide mononucleotide deamidase-related protein [Desulfobulbus sp.]|nr:CinA family nicotinamide mononucleotide deamidase-related protein [Desulfobulbus sp.]
MIGEIIAIGDELTSGRILNTTSGLAARELFLQGHEILGMHTVGDAPELIGEALAAAVARCDFVIVTGGLGPTTDDMTNEAVIKTFGVDGRVHPGVYANIAARLKDDALVASLVKMAWLPEGAEVLDPEYRMAGYLLRHQGKPIWFLPGVPPQMEILLRTKVLPSLQVFDRNHALPVCQTVYRTCGLFEIEINRRLCPLEEQGAVIGYYPVGSEVHISLTARLLEGGAVDPGFQAADAFIREVLGDNIYGVGEETLAGATGRLLRQRGLMLGTAESCTGGLIGATLTATAGSSRWFKGGVIAYANQIKERLLGVDPALLARHGAVSGETARAMAGGLLQCLDCDIAVAATGVAGPDGGSQDKPVGTVYLGLATRDTVTDRLCRFTGSRRQVQEKTAQTAVDMVRRALLAR